MFVYLVADTSPPSPNVVAGSAPEKSSSTCNKRPDIHMYNTEDLAKTLKHIMQSSGVIRNLFRGYIVHTPLIKAFSKCTLKNLNIRLITALFG